VSNNELTVVIPVEIWETIKTYNAVTFEYKDYTDNDIVELAKEKLVDFYTPLTGETDNWLKDLKYCVLFDKALSRESNLFNAIEHFTELRDKELALFEKIAKVKAQQRR
jgi:hypothetical protein